MSHSCISGHVYVMSLRVLRLNRGRGGAWSKFIQKTAENEVTWGQVMIPSWEVIGDKRMHRKLVFVAFHFLVAFWDGKLECRRTFFEFTGEKIVFWRHTVRGRDGVWSKFLQKKYRKRDCLRSGYGIKFKRRLVTKWQVVFITFCRLDFVLARR